MKKASEENGWAYVQCGDYEGYVSMKYIANEKPKEEPKPQPSTSKVEVIPGQHRDPNNIVVVLDPGHQGKGDSTKEPNGPSSSTMKARVTSGCTGVASGVPEYKLVLEISLLLKTELENRGYTSQDVSEIKINHSYLNKILSYNEWRISVEFEKEPDILFWFTYRDDKIVFQGVSSEPMLDKEEILDYSERFKNGTLLEK